jgi:polysaccharide pyruvyl transferase WcaK-like protein
MNDSRRRTPVNRVGLWGPFGFGNLGNEMTLAATSANLRRIQPGISLFAFSWEPLDTLKRHGLQSFPVKRVAAGGGVSAAAAGTRAGTCKARLQRFPPLYRMLRFFLTPALEAAFLLRAYRNLRALRLNLLVFTGTNPVSDNWGGVMPFPYNLFRWSWLARLAGARVAFLSVGAGPIKAWTSKRLIRSAIAGAAYSSVRDRSSELLFRSLYANGAVHVYPDLVFSLDVPRIAIQAAPDGNEVAVIGVPYGKTGQWDRNDAAAYDRYLQAMVEFVSWLLRNGHRVRLLSTRLGMDQTFIDDVKSELYRGGCDPGLQLVLDPSEEFEDVISGLSRATIVVTGRFHGVVFSYLLGKPVIGLAYHPKTEAVMASCGQSEFCLPLATVTSEKLQETFERLNSRRAEAADRVHAAVESNRALLDEQYRRILQA